MADITDPEAVRFVKEIIRPLAESFRALKARGADALTLWYGGLNQVITNTADVVPESRSAEGVADLSGIDVNAVMAIVDGFAGDGSPVNDQQIRKACVRPLAAT